VQQQQQQQNTMDEKSILNDLLLTHKSLMHQYSTLLAETTDPKLRGIIQDQFVNISVDQYRIYDMMSKKGYYNIKQAQPNEVQQEKQKAQQMSQSLN
jgi:spore coat protein CotF